MSWKADLWAVAALAALAAFVVWQAVRLDDLEIDRERLAAAASARAAHDATDLDYRAPVLAAQEFVERPLFWASRRPPEPVPEEQPPPPPEPPPPPPRPLPRDLVLTGVVQAGDELRALLKDRRETFRLRQGDQHQGWEVKEIRPDGVTLGYGLSTSELRLYDPPFAPAPVILPKERTDAGKGAGAPPSVQSQTPPPPAQDEKP